MRTSTFIFFFQFLFFSCSQTSEPAVSKNSSGQPIAGTKADSIIQVIDKPIGDSASVKTFEKKDVPMQAMSYEESIEFLTGDELLRKLRLAKKLKPSAIPYTVNPMTLH